MRAKKQEKEEKTWVKWIYLGLYGIIYLQLIQQLLIFIQNLDLQMIWATIISLNVVTIFNVWSYRKELLKFVNLLKERR